MIPEDTFGAIGRFLDGRDRELAEARRAEEKKQAEREKEDRERIAAEAQTRAEASAKE